MYNKSIGHLYQYLYQYQTILRNMFFLSVILYACFLVRHILQRNVGSDRTLPTTLNFERTTFYIEKIEIQPFYKKFIKNSCLQINYRD